MRLDEYLEEHGTLQTIIAKRAGVHHRTIASVLNGKDIRLSVALQIEDATKGQVTCYEMAPLKYLEQKQKNESIKKKAETKTAK